MCFQAYDRDGSGLVSKDEILKVLKISLRNNDLIDFEDAKVDQLKAKDKPQNLRI